MDSLSFKEMTSIHHQLNLKLVHFILLPIAQLKLSEWYIMSVQLAPTAKLKYLRAAHIYLNWQHGQYTRDRSMHPQAQNRALHPTTQKTKENKSDIKRNNTSGSSDLEFTFSVAIDDLTRNYVLKI